MATAKYIVGNWKLHGNAQENAARLAALKERCRPDDALAVCVPFPYLAQAQQALQGSTIGWGAQNVSEHAKGAFTGEVSAAMLADFGCGCAIVGHSERRSLYGEDDATVARKAQAVAEAGMTPIVCVGETLAERERGETAQVVTRQLAAVLAHVSAETKRRLVIAYEPVWAIGSGRAASEEDVHEVHAMLRGQLEQAGVTGTRLLYGGSVKASNAGALLNIADVDGALVGGASLDAEEFLAIAQAARV
ncbi:MAG: triose-phosphate isomerase [Proteobacteria bacterium]|nr:triose-phosphate isomerase [Pseudomonadota bacterium]MCL2307341.1 triose-phosphate isomerase [Pseudomonadota bacterium]